MKEGVVLLLLGLVAVSTQLHLGSGNEEAKKAMNAGLLEVFTDGSYDTLYYKHFGVAPTRFADCVEDEASLYYPTDLSRDGLLHSVLTSGWIKMGFFAPIATAPSFVYVDGKIEGGFYPELAELLLEKISLHYLVENIQVEWVPITQVSSFYTQHQAGLYDVIFMNLFKKSMWSAPVAPRDQLWDFSCGLLTAEPLRYYVCPASSVLDFSSASSLDGPNTRVSYIEGGAQETAALAAFPNSQTEPSNTLAELFENCENGNLEVVVELPTRVSSEMLGIMITSGPLGTAHNTGAAFRFDAEPEDCCPKQAPTRERIHRFMAGLKL